MNLIKRLFLVFICLIFSNIAFTQTGNDDWTKDADIDGAKLVIEKSKILTLPKAVRGFSKMSLLPQDEKETTVTYKLELLDYNLSDVEPNIRALQMQKEKLQKLYGNYVKAGFGNFLTPYLEGHFNSKRSENYKYGLYLRHLSSKNGAVDKANSGTSNSNALIYGSYLMDYSTLSADLGYDRQAVRFYGYDDLLTEDDIDSDSIRQIFNTISANLKLEGSGGKRSPLKYNAGVGFYTLSDDMFDISEVNTDIGLGGKYEFSDEASFGVNVNAILNKYKVGDVDFNRGIIKAGGSYHYLKEGLEVKLGAKLAYNLDSTTNLSRFTVYPDILARYQIIENKLSIFAQAEGDLQQQTFRTLIADNPFLNGSDSLRHIHNIANISGGVQIAPFEKVGLRLQGGYNIMKNFNYFMNNATDSSQFNVIYDEGTTGVFNFTTEVAVTLSNFRASLRSTFYNYNTDKIEQAIHRPTADNHLLLTYNYRDKVFFNLDAFQLSGIKAINGNGDLIDLDNIFDLNLKVDYLFSDVASAFISVKNIFGKEYERYYRYPVRGANVMIGATYAF